MEGAAARRDEWAQIVVMRGDFPRGLRFEPLRPARILVGSATGADLRLAVPQVAPRQLDVIWDGANLWLEDALRLGRTYVNGQRLNEWVVVLGQVIVSFGPVRLWMAAHGEPPGTTVPNFSALDRARLTEAHCDPLLRHSRTGRFTSAQELAPPESAACSGNPRGLHKSR